MNNHYQENFDPINILYILGPGHCGSTLLNLCLDKHSSVIGVSEIIQLNRKLPGWSGDEYVLQNNFWSKVNQEMQEKFGLAITQVSFELNSAQTSKESAIHKNKLALRSILNVSDKNIISDASKNPNRLDVLLGSKHFNVRVIYLVRDGRAVVHAYRRKYDSWFVGWRSLMRIDKAAIRLKEKYGSKNWLTIRYEDLATNPKKTLEEICTFSNINFEPIMLSPDTSKFNGIGGNRLRKHPIENIKLDTAWKNEMPRLVRTFTSLTVSSFNRKHGYKD